jgi:hypothetical protein
MPKRKKPSTQSTSWRDEYDVHPIAEMFPETRSFSMAMGPPGGPIDETTRTSVVELLFEPDKERLSIIVGLSAVEDFGRVGWWSVHKDGDPYKFAILRNLKPDDWQPVHDKLAASLRILGNAATELAALPAAHRLLLICAFAKTLNGGAPLPFGPGTILNRLGDLAEKAAKKIQADETREDLRKMLDRAGFQDATNDVTTGMHERRTDYRTLEIPDAENEDGCH